MFPIIQNSVEFLIILELILQGWQAKFFVLELTQTVPGPILELSPICCAVPGPVIELSYMCWSCSVILLPAGLDLWYLEIPEPYTARH